jgi:hypothetical protein
MQRIEPGSGLAQRGSAAAHPACQLHSGKQVMELLATLAGSLILVAGSAWWIFRK